MTAVNSLLAVATSILHGLGPVVMSNESSASAPNLDWHGEPVNHQWSKSAAAEQALQAALASRLGVHGLYFSLLRHLNEMQIARLFAGTTAYDGVLTSCNNAYTIDRPATLRWCGDCPKCRFVFLALAPFAGVERLVGIFGADLLRDESQLPGYRVLLGIGGYKPFECVGEISESQAAVARLAELPPWREAVVVQRLLPDIDRAAHAGLGRGAGPAGHRLRAGRFRRRAGQPGRRRGQPASAGCRRRVNAGAVWAMASANTRDRCSKLSNRP